MIWFMKNALNLIGSVIVMYWLIVVAGMVYALIGDIKWQ